MKIIQIMFLMLVSITSFAQKKIEINFKIENDSTIIHYLKAKKVDFSNDQIATLKGIGTFAEFSKTGRLVVPDAFFFNSKGELIKNKGKGMYCGAELKKLEKISKMKSDPGQTLENFLKEITILDGSTITDENVDMYIFITWGKFLSAESETSLNWFSNLANQENLKIKVLLLNLDIQENWNLTENQKEYLGITE
ncbi:hypothetical protein NHF50_13080 [Flavobacterium sp. NRK F10]|uniref:hypothetical protein n=1 Tax=Flavobacterium sp. NRK F10 TaxID=2954931 RepID=UPI002091CF8F|nr:hypothetical protein [Flavobacterium sp. NRK F10]MCO6175979.1 hypothetical protein [Flavobacterium sp. NRK F10]